MTHVVLLGDSIFDNQSYVGQAPDVVRQLRARLGPSWRATLLAADGDVTTDVHRQLDRVPRDATHLVVSVGGNDALGSSSVLAERAGSVAEAVSRLAEEQARFRQTYGRMVEAVAARKLPTALCTVYDTLYPEPQRRVVIAGLALYNDVITRAAFARGMPLVDLRLICTEPGDYANPIEPSAQGGEKIAAAVACLLQAGPAAGARSSVWT